MFDYADVSAPCHHIFISILAAYLNDICRCSGPKLWVSLRSFKIVEGEIDCSSTATRRSRLRDAEGMTLVTVGMLSRASTRARQFKLMASMKVMIFSATFGV